jgi:UDP-N-acetylglucosamine 2-epimerase (hydrolysing)
MVLVHGDRYESLAAAISASSINILVGHIEGGELSGNIDEHLRHAISKLSNLHFVSNKDAKKNLIQMGEKDSTIFEVGSPDIDIMNSKNLPNLDTVKKRYNIEFSDFSILIFHPFNFQNLENYKKKIISVIESIKNSRENYIIIYPNNDYGNNVIIEMYKRHLKEKNFKIIRSCRFEYFLTLLKNSKLIIGNSSAGIREAPFYGVPSINIGERQKNRFIYPSIMNLNFEKKKILNAINKLKNKKFKKTNFFGDGKSDKKIYSILSNKKTWKISRQKQLILKDF